MRNIKNDEEYFDDFDYESDKMYKKADKPKKKPNLKSLSEDEDDDFHIRKKSKDDKRTDKKRKH